MPLNMPKVPQGVSITNKGKAAMYATQDLRDEHEGILLMLSVLERLGTTLQMDHAVNLQDLEQILGFLSNFADRCHHGKEEDVLFPSLIRAGIPDHGGPIGVMLAEHAQGRSLIQAMRESLSRLQAGDEASRPEFVGAALGYVRLLRDHIDKENTILFVIAEQRLTSDEHARLAEGFTQIERERIGDGVHEQYHALLHQLRDTYL